MIIILTIKGLVFKLKLAKGPSAQFLLLTNTSQLAYPILAHKQEATMNRNDNSLTEIIDTV